MILLRFSRPLSQITCGHGEGYSFSSSCVRSSSLSFLISSKPSASRIHPVTSYGTRYQVRAETKHRWWRFRRWNHCSQSSIPDQTLRNSVAISSISLLASVFDTRQHFLDFRQNKGGEPGQGDSAEVILTSFNLPQGSIDLHEQAEQL